MVHLEKSQKNCSERSARYTLYTNCCLPVHLQLCELYVVLLIDCHTPLFGEADIGAKEHICQSQLPQIEDSYVSRFRAEGHSYLRCLN